MYFSRSVSPLRNTFGLFGLFERLLGRCCGLLWLLLGDTLRLNIAILAAASIFAAFSLGEWGDDACNLANKRC